MTKLCNKCGATIVKGEPDPCLDGYLPGIAHACCGHEDTEEAYCCGWNNCFPNERIIEGQDKFIYLGKRKFTCGREGYWEYRGQEAIDYMEELKNA